ncbi:MAG: LacI family DNA-binding transcriptional regulator [Saccharofermentanales bacterium]
MAAIKDVAKLSGLSVAAVSKYLKDAGSVREDTKARIEQAIQDLSYVPSPIARSLRTKKTGMIAVVVPSITNPFFTELFDAIRIECLKTSILAVLYSVSYPQENVEVIQSIVQRQLDGVILCFPDSELFLSQILERSNGLPAVVMSWHKVASGARTILLDVRKGIFDTSDHLIRSGCRTIAYLGGDADSVISKEKYVGFETAMSASGIPIYPELVKRNQTTMRYGYQAMNDLIGTERIIDGIVCENDVLAIGCINYCLQNHIDIPHQLKVTGFDDIPLASMFEPQITTASLPIEEMGRCAVGMLFPESTGETNGIDRRFEAVLVKRSTT